MMDTTMLTSETILDCLKKSVLEYGLKNRIDPLVSGLACNTKGRFSSYNINPVRFELYNMYLMIRRCQYDRFNTIVSFLHELHSLCPTLLPEKLYSRVIAAVKCLHIYECLRVGDLKKTSVLIKEYFPVTHSFNPLGQSNRPSESGGKDTLELKILKLRTQWNELILNKSKRESFFKDQFHIHYDQKFLGYLLAKVNEIIDIINSHLPPTKIEQIIHSNFSDPNYILFSTNKIELELEDHVRLELYMDHLHLHHHESQSDKSAFGKHLRKILKMLVEWETRLFSDSVSNDTSMLQTYPSTGQNDYVHDMLYLDSQLEGVDGSRYNEEASHINETSDHEGCYETKEMNQESSNSNSSNTTNCQSNLMGSIITEDNSTTTTTTTTTSHSIITNNNSTEFDTAESRILKDSTVAEQPAVNTISELITDDEKDD